MRSVGHQRSGADNKEAAASETEITIIGQVDTALLPAFTDIEWSGVGVAYLSASCVTLPNYFNTAEKRSFRIT